MLISELMAQKRCIELKRIRPDCGLLEMAEELNRHDIGVLLVVDAEGKLVGVSSERDLARAIATHSNGLFDRTVADIMTPTVVTCTPNDNVIETLDVMNDNNIRHIPVVEDGAPKAMLSIKEFHLAYQTLQTQARTDHLTGLANRRHFMELMEEEISRRRRFESPLSLAMLDLDNFKQINDTYGHEAGDQVLRVLSKLLKRQLRAYDSVGRLGGEEFALLFPNTDLERAVIACNRVVDAIRMQDVVAGEQIIHFTASLGLVETTTPGETAQAMLKRADVLLYQAKAEGRDRIATKLVEESAVAVLL